MSGGLGHAGPPVGAVILEVGVDPSWPSGSTLADLAVWMDLAQPPDDPPVVARWSALCCRCADGSEVSVGAVLVTFPAGSEWRRLDVVVDDVGVLQVSNTARTAANMAVLALPDAR